MSDTKSSKLPHSSSYTSVYDSLKPASFNSLFYNSPGNEQKEHSVFHVKCRDSTMKSFDLHYTRSRSVHYITSENQHLIKKESYYKSVVPSTSTIFYDLDDIAKRHSFHCLTELGQSNSNFLKVMSINGSLFAGKSNAIVQECATQMHPNLLLRDSMDINSKKVKKKMSGDLMLSSEIFLRDNDYVHDYERNFYRKDISDKQQKFWSYAKYRTEYTKPIPEDKKSKKKDKGKRTEDPCPCQLFSYACPCTDKKSLTELAKSSKSVTANDQNTSTSITLIEERKDGKQNSRMKRIMLEMERERVKEDKLTNTSIPELIEVMVPLNDSSIDAPKKQHTVQTLVDEIHVHNIKNNKNKFKARKKQKRVFCPKCKEEVDVEVNISTTEEEESLKLDNSSLYHTKEVPSTTAYTYRSSPNNIKNKIMDEELCMHEPPCEMLPICQILPTDNALYNIHKCVKKNSMAKSNTPRVIRITKACRHHPPCTTVPSCQRANVLKNNCGYVPPCMHRPRCINLPLCVPFSKSLHYDEMPPKLTEDIENTECPHVPRCKYLPICQHDSLVNLDHHQINMVSQVQNTCEFLNDYNAPTFLLNPNSFSPYQLSNGPGATCRSNKSCQFDRLNSKHTTEESQSNDTVVFIRDVGCQFRNKSYSPKDSILQSKTSSNSFEFIDVKQVDNYFRNIHTLRYEDKCTNPSVINDTEKSFSMISITSVDSDCPSHGRRASRYSRKIRPGTGFHPQSAYVAAFSTMKDSEAAKYKDINKSCGQDCRDCFSAFPVRSNRSFLKGKYKKMFTIRRRRKSRLTNPLVIASSKRTKD